MVPVSKMERACAVLFLCTVALHAALGQTPQRGPLSKAEVLEMIKSSAPDRAMLEMIQQCGIAFAPTREVLNEFRKAGAHNALLAELTKHAPEQSARPLGQMEILLSVAEGETTARLIQTMQQRGIDFRPSEEFLAKLQGQGADAALLDALRQAKPVPLSQEWLVRALDAHQDSHALEFKVMECGIDFEPSEENLAALRKAGAPASLLTAVHGARRGDTFVPAPATPLRATEGTAGAEVMLNYSPSGPDSQIAAPVPISKREPEYTKEAVRHQLEGLVSLWIVVDAHGDVSDVRETSARLGDGLDESAIATVKTWKFQPAKRGETPVPVRVRVEVQFRFCRPT